MKQVRFFKKTIFYGKKANWLRAKQTKKQDLSLKTKEAETLRWDVYWYFMQRAGKLE